MTFSGYRDNRRKAEAKVVNVNDPNQAYLNQQPHWDLVETLVGGTYDIRQKHRKYLPQEPRETDEQYDLRLYRSCLSPLYSRLEKMLAGFLVRKPVRLNNTDDEIREDLFDVNLMGDDLNIYTFEIAKKCIRYGHIGVLVDSPRAEDGTGRPYWVTYTPKDIIGWRTEKKEGRDELVQLRLTEKVVIPDGPWGEKEVEQIRVLTPGAYEIYQKDAKSSDFKVVESGATSLDRIPFAVAYSNRVGLYESRPPMSDICELNLKHYQISSDYDHMLHISAVPMLGLFGYPQTDGEIAAGPGEAICMPAEATASYIEPSGNSFDAQSGRIEQIEKQINDLGLAAVLGTKLTAESAKKAEIDRSQGDSTMKVLAQQVQDLIDNCLEFHGEYLNKNPGSCFINRDFLSSRLDPAEINSLLQLYTAGTISKETLLEQLNEGEVLGDDFNIEEELEATEQAGLVDMLPPEEKEEA
tara:strand:- start:837 stop:2237 length:1401 start_codon:yes stop_codon:yes gene_type:complete